MIVEKCVS